MLGYFQNMGYSHFKVLQYAYVPAWLAIKHRRKLQVMRSHQAASSQAICRVPINRGKNSCKAIGYIAIGAKLAILAALYLFKRSVHIHRVPGWSWWLSIKVVRGTYILMTISAIMGHIICWLCYWLCLPKSAIDGLFRQNMSVNG